MAISVVLLRGINVESPARASPWPTSAAALAAAGYADVETYVQSGNLLVNTRVGAGAPPRPTWKLRPRASSGSRSTQSCDRAAAPESARRQPDLAARVPGAHRFGKAKPTAAGRHARRT